jgi:hypothetical protein
MYLEYGGTQNVFYLLTLNSNSMELPLFSNFQIVKKIPYSLHELEGHYYELCMFHIHALKNIYTDVVNQHYILSLFL